MVYQLKVGVQVAEEDSEALCVARSCMVELKIERALLAAGNEQAKEKRGTLVA